MKLDFSSVRITDLINDPIQYKLFIAEQSLDEIPEIMPLENDSEEYLRAETNIEIFLLFLTSAHDGFFHEINQKMQLNLDTSGHHNITPKLETMNKNAKDIAKEIRKYFSSPELRVQKLSQQRAADIRKYEDTSFGIMSRLIEFNDVATGLAELHMWDAKLDDNAKNFDAGTYERYWNRENSSQWIAKQLRNEIAHGRFVIYTSKHNLDDDTRERTMTVRFIHKVGRNSRQFWFDVKNVHGFFSKQLEKMQFFVKDVRKLLDGVAITNE